LALTPPLGKSEVPNMRSRGSNTRAGRDQFFTSCGRFSGFPAPGDLACRTYRVAYRMVARMNFFAGFFYIGSILALAASPLDDKARAFEDALDATPAEASLSAAGLPPPLTARDLEAMLQRGDQEAAIESLASQLMNTHPYILVQQTGRDFIRALKEERAQDFPVKAKALLAETKEAVTHAQSAGDLDKVLGELHDLTNPQVQSVASDPSSQELFTQLNLALQFVRPWQEYLSASAAGKTEEVQEALRQILVNTQLDVLGYFPRSEILARRDPGPTVPSLKESPSTQADDFLGEVRTVEDFSTAINRISHIPNHPDLLALITLEQAREDVVAGLPITLSLKDPMGDTYFGDNISRITALELLAILPYYFNTENSDPPKHGETLNDYLDRLTSSSDASGNLALLQRVLAVKVAIIRGNEQDFGAPIEKVLAGLTQEADGQYASAVVSYETALKDYDPMLPVKVMGDRLAAIKTAHPDEYNQGMTTFLTPEPVPVPGFPWQQPRMFPRRNLVSVMPIPMNISIPAHPTTNAAPADSTPSTTQ
jgi:hypothetical protein